MFYMNSQYEYLYAPNPSQYTPIPPNEEDNKEKKEVDSCTIIEMDCPTESKDE